jgi:hypothetical protein
MTSNARGGTRILGSLRSADGKGVVRMQDRFDTDIDDLPVAALAALLLTWKPSERGPHADRQTCPITVRPGSLGIAGSMTVHWSASAAQVILI